MNLIIRLLVLVLKRIFYKPKSDLLNPIRTQFWVNPFDIDINLHMNNGRYLSIMDLGRYDLMIRTNFFWTFFFQGIYPVVVSESIRFKKSLEPFAFFEIETKIESWNDKDFYIQQTFLRNQEVYATGYIQGRFRQRGKTGSLKTSEVFKLIGLNLPLEQKSLLSQQQSLIGQHLS